MVNEKTIKIYLDNYFHIEFFVEKKDGKYVISFSKTEDHFFNLKVEIKDDIRLTIIVEPETYGKSFLETINASSKEKRQIFTKYWETLGFKKISLKINDSTINPEEFITNTNIWNTFLLRYSISPYYNEDIEKENNVYNAISSIISMVLSISEYTILGYSEGNEIISVDKKYERNPINRKLCLLNKGYTCSVCGFNFQKVYGKIGENFIEVHHTLPVSQMEENHIVDPIKELYPVCSNCHSMLHQKNPPYSIDELKQIITEERK